MLNWGFPGVEVVKNPSANAGDIRDMGLIPGSGHSPGLGNGNPLQYSYMENSMGRGAWWATVHKNCKELDTTERACMHTHTHTHIFMLLIQFSCSVMSDSLRRHGLQHT